MRKNSRHPVAPADIDKAWQAVYVECCGYKTDDLVADGWMNADLFSKKYKITIDTARHRLERNVNLERRSFRVQTAKSIRQVNFYRPKKS